MLILSVDSSATPASVCLYNDRMIAEYFIHTALTHSETLVAMIESVLKTTGTDPADIECFAVNHGPGSFTGVRIGVSAVKGMAYATDKPCVAVSTLESMAYNLLASDALICACMDARRHQAYNALFRVKDGAVERLCDDRAIGVEELIAEIKDIPEQIILVGKNVCHDDRNTFEVIWKDEKYLTEGLPVRPGKKMHDLLAVYEGLVFYGLSGYKDNHVLVYKEVYPFNNGLKGNMTEWGSSLEPTGYKKVLAAVGWI